MSMFSLWQGRSAGMGLEFWYPPKKSTSPISPENMIGQEYKDVKNIKNSLAHKVQCRLCQSNPHFNRQKQAKKNNHPVLTNLC